MPQNLSPSGGGADLPPPHLRHFQVKYGVPASVKAVRASAHPQGLALTESELHTTGRVGFYLQLIAK